MANENLALVIIEEGIDSAESGGGVGCCWTLFVFFAH